MALCIVWILWGLGIFDLGVRRRSLGVVYKLWVRGCRLLGDSSQLDREVGRRDGNEVKGCAYCVSVLAGACRAGKAYGEH